MPQTFTKDPAAKLDYVVDWTEWLIDGDTIDLSTWEAETGITVDSDDHTLTTARVWLSGGTRGKTYTVTNKITTLEGREDERSIFIKCRNR